MLCGCCLGCVERGLPWSSVVDFQCREGLSMGKSGVDVTMTLPRSLLKGLDRYAKSQGVSRSAACRELLAAALEDGESVVKVMANDKVREALLAAMMRPGVLQSLANALGHDLDADQAQKVFEFFEAASTISRKAKM